MRNYALSSIIVLCLVAVGCAQNGSQELAIKKELTADNAQITKLNNEVSSLKREVSILKIDNGWQSVIDKVSRIAYLTPASGGYSTVKIDEGYITIALVNVRPYANGSKITLRFGNPMAATLTDVKMKLEWGTTDASGNADNKDEESRNVSLVKSLRGGSWTEETFVLESIPASKLGFVRVLNVTHRGMSLRRSF